MRQSLRHLLNPGDALAGALGLAPESDHRQIVRMYVNILTWGTLGALAAFMVAV